MKPARETLPDALRACAILGVLLVNAVGYLSSPWGPILGSQAAADGGAALVLQGLLATFVQGKAYPVLAFLFGMSLWLATRGRRAEALERAYRRQRRLLLLGLLHGVFVYFGDILTAYALVGLALLPRVHEPWSALRPRLRRAVGWTLAISGSVALLGLLALWAGWLHEPPAETAADRAFPEVPGWADFLKLNAGAYAVMLIGLFILGWPIFRLCMLAGIAAARLRLLTHRRWREVLRRWLRAWAVPALVLNAAYAGAYTAHSGQRGEVGAIEGMGFLVGLPLAAVYVVALALAAQRAGSRWPQVLAPLGRRTLTLYVGHGALCVLLFSGAGLGWAPGVFGIVVFAGLLWLLALAAARACGTRRWPLEAWMARR